MAKRNIVVFQMDFLGAHTTWPSTAFAPRPSIRQTLFLMATPSFMVNISKFHNCNISILANTIDICKQIRFSKPSPPALAGKYWRTCQRRS